MKSILRKVRSGFVVLCVIAYTVAGSIIVFALFPFFGRRAYLDIATRIWVRLILWTGGVRVTVEGLEHISADEDYVFVANHQSHFDIPACIAAIPARLRMMAKKELFRIPLFGWSMRIVGHIVIDREDRDRALKSVDQAVERLKHENITPVVYPEGTRSPDGRIGQFKKGAFVLAIKSRRPVVPVTIIGSREVLPKNSIEIHSGTIRVYIGKPVPTDSMKIADREKLAHTVRSVIENTLHEKIEEISDKGSR